MSVRQVGDPPMPTLYWEFAAPMRAISSAPHGGGIGERRWVLNAQVPSDYARTDIDTHLDEISLALGTKGSGVGFLTAASVELVAESVEDFAHVFATVGLQHPTWAASEGDVHDERAIGTINIVAVLPTALDDSALVNAVGTATEAKSQALLEIGVPGTGTASDALCILTSASGPADRFCGPRSRVGASLARAVHKAVLEGARR